MFRETWVQSQVELYQRLKKWYLMLPCLTLSIIRYVSMVKWGDLGKGVAPSPTPRCSSYWKGSFRVALDYRGQLYLLYLSESEYNGMTGFRTRLLRCHSSARLPHGHFPVGWGCRIHRLHLWRGVRPPPPTSVLDMTLSNLMFRFQ